ncbi:hypothetical protein GCM10009850_047980 [Nonomuraea monospora]|uniref:Uncharacterized protein n=1 Tax=Nonomuraea monospora TaxID=568818 RepID=A0ABN3CJB8_9ACTN
MSRAEERVQEFIEDAMRRREGRRRAQAEFAERRAHGLKRRHATKLAHSGLNVAPQTDEESGVVPWPTPAPQSASDSCTETTWSWTW